VRHVVDRQADGYRATLGEHSCDCFRRGEVSGQTLHENCADFARLDAICQASDRFRFQSGSSGHGNAT